MRYQNIVKGEFIDRPNRFIANVSINNKPTVCHVKNTGRCKELLIKGCTVYLDRSLNTTRKTEYDLVAVEKDGLIINIDSQAPNKAAAEFLASYFGNNAIITPEKSYKNSRFDFYIEKESRKIFLEVKGVTLKEGSVALFPDAPTERGVKHIKELISATDAGFESYILFVIQMKGVSSFTPNYQTHKEFGETLKEALENNVKILAYDSLVTPNSIEIDNPVQIIL